VDCSFSSRLCLRNLGLDIDDRTEERSRHELLYEQAKSGERTSEKRNSTKRSHCHGLRARTRVLETPSDDAEFLRNEAKGPIEGAAKQACGGENAPNQGARMRRTKLQLLTEQAARMLCSNPNAAGSDAEMAPNEPKVNSTKRTQCSGSLVRTRALETRSDAGRFLRNEANGRSRRPNRNRRSRRERDGGCLG